MKRVRWEDKSRMEKIAGAVYPHLLDEVTRKEMAQANPEIASRLGYSSTQVREPPNNYHLIPTLKRKR